MRLLFIFVALLPTSKPHGNAASSPLPASARKVTTPGVIKKTNHEGAMAVPLSGQAQPRALSDTSAPPSQRLIDGSSTEIKFPSGVPLLEALGFIGEMGHIICVKVSTMESTVKSVTRPDAPHSNSRQA